MLAACEMQGEKELLESFKLVELVELFKPFESAACQLRHGKHANSLALKRLPQVSYPVHSKEVSRLCKQPYIANLFVCTPDPANWLKTKGL